MLVVFPFPLIVECLVCFDLVMSSKPAWRVQLTSDFAVHNEQTYQVFRAAENKNGRRLGC